MKGAIFDMDGTLLDSMGVWDGITDRFFRKYKLTCTPELLAMFQELTISESCRIIKERFSIQQSAEEINSEFNQMAAHEYTYNIPLKPYAREYVTKLYSEGVKLAIATSGYGELCRAALSRTGILNMFSAIALSSEVKVNKTNPDVYLLAAERIGVPPVNCTVYEDILSGITGAKKAGMTTVAIFDKSSEKLSERIKSEADKYITSWEELL